MSYPGFDDDWLANRGIRPRRNATQPRQAVKATTGKGKYGNQRTEVDGIKFDSKREAAYFQDLKLRVKSGEVLWFIRQPSFDLPGGVKYRADFLIVEKENLRVVDVKGYYNRESKNKVKMVEALYPVTVEIIK